MRDINKLFLVVYEGSEPLYETTLFPPIRSSKKNWTPIQDPRPTSRYTLYRIFTKALRWLFPPETDNTKKVLHIALTILLEDAHNISSSWKQRCLRAMHRVGKDLGIYMAQEEISQLSSSLPSWWEEARVSAKDLAHVYSLMVDVVEQPPLRSILHIEGESGSVALELATHYSQYKIEARQPDGHVIYHCHANRATSILANQGNYTPNERGVMDQSRLLASGSSLSSLTYSGPIETPTHLLEEVLHIHDLQKEPVYLQERGTAPSQWIMMTSFYTWKEFEWVAQQRQAIQELDGKYLSTPDQSYQLRFLYTNLPLHATWAPRELHAVLQDINLESYLWITLWTYQKFHLPLHALKEWTDILSKNSPDFFKKETARLHILDHFKESIPEITRVLNTYADPLAQGLRLLLLEQRQDGETLNELDRFLLLSLITQSLQIPHHKNSGYHLAELAYAKALDKAQYVYTQWNQSPFLPGRSSKEEQQFLSLYSLYLEWEESTIHRIRQSATPL